MPLPRSSFLALLVLSMSPACGEDEKSPPATLKKMDFKLTVDERGRMLPEISFFNQKHDPFILVGGSYTMTLARADGTILCSTTRTLAKEDYSGTSLKSDWHDAACPPDPASDELRITLEVKTTDKPDAPKLSRDKTTPTKFIYRHLAAKQPPGSPPTAVDPTKLPAEAPLPEPPPAGTAGSAATPTASGSAANAAGTSGTDNPAAPTPTDKPTASDKPAAAAGTPTGKPAAATRSDKPSSN